MPAQWAPPQPESPRAHGHLKPICCVGNPDAATADAKRISSKSNSKLGQSAEQGDQLRLTSRLRFCEDRRQLGSRRAYFDAQPGCHLFETIPAGYTLRQADLGLRQIEHALQHLLTGGRNLVEIRESHDGPTVADIRFADFERDQLLFAVACDENRGDVVFESVIDLREEAATGGFRHAVQKTMSSGSRAKHALELDHRVPFWKLRLQPARTVILLFGEPHSA